MEPFTSNDTYVCPDCGSEVKVGARSCPGCGPFQPMEWENDEASTPAEPFHSSTTYTDTRVVMVKSPRRFFSRLPHEFNGLRFVRIFLIILIGLTVISAIMAALRLGFGQ